MSNKFLFYHHLVPTIINIISIHRIIYVIIQVNLVNFFSLALGRRNAFSLTRLFSPKQPRGSAAGLQSLRPLPSHAQAPSPRLPFDNSPGAVGGAEGTRLRLAQGPSSAWRLAVTAAAQCPPLGRLSRRHFGLEVQGFNRARPCQTAAQAWFALGKAIWAAPDTFSSFTHLGKVSQRI